MIEAVSAVDRTGEGSEARAGAVVPSSSSRVNMAVRAACSIASREASLEASRSSSSSSGNIIVTDSTSAVAIIAT